jgi:hypothetical protein
MKKEFLDALYSRKYSVEQDIKDYDTEMDFQEGTCDHVKHQAFIKHLKDYSKSIDEIILDYLETHSRYIKA